MPSLRTNALVIDKLRPRKHHTQPHQEPASICPRLPIPSHGTTLISPCSNSQLVVYAYLSSRSSINLTAHSAPSFGSSPTVNPVSLQHTRRDDIKFDQRITLDTLLCLSFDAVHLYDLLMHRGPVHADLGSAVRWVAAQFLGKRVLDAAEAGGYVDDFGVGRFVQERREGVGDEGAGCDV